MDGRLPAADAHGSGGAASADVAVMEAAVLRHAGQLGDIRRRALAVALRSWESPAGGTFRIYLAERCAELSRTIDLLETAARELGDYGRLLREAELLHGQAGR